VIIVISFTNYTNQQILFDACSEIRCLTLNDSGKAIYPICFARELSIGLAQKGGGINSSPISPIHPFVNLVDEAIRATTVREWTF